MHIPTVLPINTYMYVCNYCEQKGTFRFGLKLGQLGGQSSLLVRKKFLSVLEEVSLLGSKCDQLLKVGGGSGGVCLVDM